MAVAGKRAARCDESGQVSKTINNNLGEHLNFLYTNADCLTNKRQELQSLLGSLVWKPSVIIITEVNSKVSFNNLQESEYSLEGYNVFVSNVGVDKFCGIIIYVDKSILCSQLHVFSKFSEFLFIKIMQGNSCALTIGAIYRRPGSSKDNDMQLFKLINDIVKQNPGNLLLVGDFNFPIINWCKWTVEKDTSSKSSESKFISCLRKNYLKQHINFPTRVRGSQTPHVLDLVISNNDFVNNINNLSPLGKSDHSVLQFSCQFLYSHVEYTPKFNYVKGDYDNLRLFVNNCYSSPYLVNECCEVSLF